MIRPEEWDRFFTKLEERGNVSDSCKESGIARSTVYERIDGKFPADTTEEEKTAWKARYDDALRASMDKLESEAFRRAHDGYMKKSYTIPGSENRDEKHVEEWAYSDTLMVLLLKAHRPEKYKDRVANEHTGANGGPIKTENKVIAVPMIPDNSPE